ncbi:type IV pilus biogenesis/stability protein PilW [Thalassotalea sp. M1531]|uniref:Type IV pilus biogenesis/stability protein PilW n=1 Tax=Thalassotalea algicola TaxID=2716224 RepID=A0A7Y0Q7Q7_9GAMM|nr:type IV pilus biogenesis/stability protein PilW [Thalassotalea algicola]NMP32162.1 type IV pilus biogenesis/stability protein PilW [Thalassotalea algicola]
MVKAFKLLTIAVVLTSVSGCVTQNYENSNTPVVQNDSSSTEIAMTRISLGLGYLKMGNTTQAKLNLEKAKRFAPNLVQVHTAFAHYYETVGEDNLTIASYEKALSLKPDDADTLNNYGVFLCRKDRLPEAEVQFLRAIAVPTYLLVSQSYQNLAQCQLKAPNFEKAQLYLEKAVDHNPSSASNLYQMMRLLYAQGRYQEALAYSKRFEKATRRFNPDSLSLSYKIYQKMGNQRIAKNYGAMLVKMFPESWHAKQYLLNELEKIEADELAEKYQLLKLGAYDKPESKRVVKLTPSDKPAVSIARTKKKPITPRSVNKKKVVQLSPPDEQLASRQKSAAGKKTVVLKAPDNANKEVLNHQVASVEAQENIETEQVKVEVAKQAVAQEKAPELLKVEQSGAQEVVQKTESDLVQVQTEALKPHNREEDIVVDSASDKAEEIVRQVANPDSTTEREAEQDLVQTSEPEDAADALVIELSEQAAEQKAHEVASVDIPENTTQQQQLVTDSLVSSVNDSELNDLESVTTTDDIIDTASDEVASMEEQSELIDQSTNNEFETDTAVIDAVENIDESNNLPVEETNEQEIVSNGVVTDEVITETMVSETQYQSLEELPQHEIQKGENLFTVSKKYNIHLRSLKKWNNLDERALVRIGDIIYLADPSIVNSAQEQ